MKNRGFSLIELMVVVAGGVVILTIAFFILASIFKQANRSKLTKIIDDQSAWLNFELKKNLRNAKADSVSCEGDSISFLGKMDGRQTVISCSQGKVASVSATSVDLVSGVIVSGCDSFVSCRLGPVPVVDFSYIMEAGNDLSGKPEDFLRKNFVLSVVVRN